MSIVLFPNISFHRRRIEAVIIGFGGPLTCIHPDILCVSSISFLPAFTLPGARSILSRESATLAHRRLSISYEMQSNTQHSPLRLECAFLLKANLKQVVAYLWLQAPTFDLSPALPSAIGHLQPSSPTYHPRMNFNEDIVHDFWHHPLRLCDSNGLRAIRPSRG